MEQTFLTVVVVPAALFTIMIGLGLSLTTADFRRVASSRRALAVGLIGQLILLPAVGYVIVTAFDLPPVFALGLMVLALSPGGALSNAISHVVGANLALSVTLTAIASLITPFTIPLVYGWASAAITGDGGTLTLPIGRTVIQLLMIGVVPIVLGMALRKAAPKLAARADRPVRIAAVLFFLMVILGVIRQNWDSFPRGFAAVGLPALALNLGGMALGLIGARLARVEPRQAVTIAIEVGMQNAATATFVTATLLGDVTMAIAPAIYATLMVPSALIFGGIAVRACTAAPRAGQAPP